MCLAPRYMSGPTATPWTDWRNTASFPETPCALTGGASSVTVRAIARSTRRLVGAAIFLMAVVTSFIQVPATLEHLLRALFLRRAQHGLSGVDHRPGHDDPVLLVHGAA